MLDATFEISNIALVIAIGLIILFYWLLRWTSSFSKPKLFVSDFSNLQTTPSWRVQGANLSRYLLYSSLGLFVLAFIDPRLQLPKTGPMTIAPTEGIVIYLVADQSGSMNERTSSKSGRDIGKISKIDLLKKIGIDFVMGNLGAGLKGRPEDLIGLVGFARTAHVLVPLTTDHAEIVRVLTELQTVKDKDQDGTALGYAIYKTINILISERHFAESHGEKPAFDILSSVILVITDGFQEINPKDKGNPLRDIGLEEAAKYAKENDIKLFILNVEPAFTSEEFIPHRRLLERITELTGGHFYTVQNTIHLDQVYAALNKLQTSILRTPSAELLEVSKDQQPHRYRRVSAYPYLIAMGMASLLLSVILKTTQFRKTP